MNALFNDDLLVTDYPTNTEILEEVRINRDHNDLPSDEDKNEVASGLQYC